MRSPVDLRGMRRISFVLIISIGLAGCNTTQEAFIGPSGLPTSSAKCSQSPDGCFKAASATCHGPYQVLDSESHAGGLLADALPGPVMWYRMTYQCGPSNGRIPSFPLRGDPPHLPTPPPIMVQTPNPPTPPPPPGAWSIQPSPNILPRQTNCQTYGSTTNCTTF